MSIIREQRDSSLKRNVITWSSPLSHIYRCRGRITRVWRRNIQRIPIGWL